MNVCIISHKRCPDGCASVVLSKKIHPDIQYNLCTHQVVDNISYQKATQLDDGGTFYFVDICCTSEILDKVVDILLRKKASLYIYEHHQTQVWLQKYSFPATLEYKLVFDNDRCASKIFYDEKKLEYPEIKKYDEFIEIINDRDLWLNKKKEGIIFAKLHNIYGDRDFIHRFLKNPSKELSLKENTLLEYQEKKDLEVMRQLLDRAIIEKDKEGFNYTIVYGQGNSSDILNEAIQRYSLEYAIMINLNKKSGSIRSRGKFDCSKFSEKYGGGGHKMASGFPIQFDFKLF